ncbi:hypothetical protein ACOMHN_058573 [Nucella lapillus]
MAFMIIAIVCVSVAIVTGVDGRRHGSVRCGLFEYYDKHMDDCGPCNEICDAMELTKTEKQCKSSCSGYLMAAKCTYNQYYDDVVGSCAPCSELCSLSHITGTTEECSTRCHNYLKAQNCTDEQFFDETGMACAECSQLCSQRDESGNTTQACFNKCPRYIERHPPSNILQRPEGAEDPRHAKAQADPEKNESSVHPGLILAAAIVLLANVVIFSLIVFWVRRNKHAAAYTPAHSVEVNVDLEDRNDAATEPLTLQTDDLNPVFQLATSASASPTCAQEPMNIASGVRHGIQERDPAASSAFSYICEIETFV